MHPVAAFAFTALEIGCFTAMDYIFDLLQLFRNFSSQFSYSEIILI